MLALSPDLRYALWAVIVLGCLVLLGVVLMAARRLARSRHDAPREALSINDLEKLRQQGLIDEAEFRVLRRSALGLPAEENQDSPSRRPVESDDVIHPEPESPDSQEPKEED